jgi:chloramphenicol-sensitive protein RarD
LSNRSDEDNASRSGLVAGLIAYSLWGVFPIYFKLVAVVPPAEVLMHRIVWAVPFGALILFFRKQWPEVRRALTHRSTVLWLSLSALLITVNWFIYIWAVINERIFETSLGYYINPLMLVLVGVLFFNERLRPLQIFAVVSAAIGVSVLAISGGEFPWVALSLGALFTGYGVIRKRVEVGAMPGLFVETTLLFPLALMPLLWIVWSGASAFTSGDSSLSLLLILAGPVTVMPLLLFAIAARKLTLTTVGFLQFLAPTLQFLTGVYYREELTTAHLICFGLIWTAVALFSIDAFRATKKPLKENPARA